MINALYASILGVKIKFSHLTKLRYTLTVLRCEQLVILIQSLICIEKNSGGTKLVSLPRPLFSFTLEKKAVWAARLGQNVVTDYLMYVCMYVSTYIHTYIHTHTHTHV